jgi:hypothetical protein
MDMITEDLHRLTVVLVLDGYVYSSRPVGQIVLEQDRSAASSPRYVGSSPSTFTGGRPDSDRLPAKSSRRPTQVGGRMSMGTVPQPNGASFRAQS